MRKIKALESISGLGCNLQEALRLIPDDDKYFIALSGGLDSIALTYFCLPYLKEKTNNIQAIHVNHGLSENAKSWAEFCQAFCLSLGIECHTENVTVQNDGDGLEAAARAARYAVFNRYLENGGVLLQGHHLNDQAETVLMRLFKGLGPESLRGIPKERLLSNGLLFRPWLDLSRDVIRSNAEKYALSWVEDESNQDVRFERNYLRNEVFPLLSLRQPSIYHDLARAAKKSQDAAEFIQEWCGEQKVFFLSAEYAKQKAINIEAIKTYTSRQQTFLLRYWFDLLGMHHPTEGNFQRIFDDLLQAGADTKAEVNWKGRVLKCFDGALFCLPESIKAESDFDNKLCLPKKLEQPIVIKLPHGDLIISKVSVHGHTDDICKQNVNQCDGSYEVYCRIPNQFDALTVRSRKAGDKIYLQSEHSSSLKKLYQSNKVFPWHRNKLPLIYVENTLICSLAGFVAKDFLPKYESGDITGHASALYCFRFEFG